MQNQASTGKGDLLRGSNKESGGWVLKGFRAAGRSFRIFVRLSLVRTREVERRCGPRG